MTRTSTPLKYSPESTSKLLRILREAQAEITRPAQMMGIGDKIAAACTEAELADLIRTLDDMGRDGNGHWLNDGLMFFSNSLNVGHLYKRQDHYRTLTDEQILTAWEALPPYHELDDLTRDSYQACEYVMGERFPAVEQQLDNEAADSDPANDPRPLAEQNAASKAHTIAAYRAAATA